ncbi:unnamed protein product (macronuclear) [Paramecium tetraurelia]|uniref:Transmembrane protein n=1 Tax=Paramecium tetraurelia TaxID=5888 RepID=A0E7N2_PARTE|nr:uncharacterized protein GSPATT00024027001 [Paramecium tetraurelia]CAK91299.1 unnamed protein product [Paramecium tetraurelia]|eukprot:XP_001458696.1 hypothetical protein (macronuclear) [Paramecium tetraurelia strain d4-2]
MQILQQISAKTIFTYLDTLDLQIVDAPSRKNTTSPLRSQSKEQKELKTLHEYDGTIICNCYDCFCEGCPWEQKCICKCCFSIGQCCTMLQNKFLESLKYIIFFLTKPYFYIIFNSYFSLIGFKNDDKQDEKDHGGIILGFGIIFNGLQFYVLLFAFSFLSTKREMMRLDKSKEDDRGLLLYYHIRKAIIFTIFLVLLFIFFGLGVCRLIYRFQIKSECLFILYNIIFLFIGSIVSVLLMSYNNCLSNDLIQDNDNILKAQQRLYIMQNNLIKYFPSEQQFQKYVEECNFDDQQISRLIHEKCSEAKGNLQLSLGANDKQQFKKIKKNLGQSKFLIGGIVSYLYLSTYLTLLASFGFLLMVLINVYENIKNGDEEWKDQLESVIQPKQPVFSVILLTLQLIQALVLPHLLPFLFIKKRLFGQDYGEWE